MVKESPSILHWFLSQVMLTRLSKSHSHVWVCIVIVEKKMHPCHWNMPYRWVMMIGAINLSVNLLLCSPCAIDNTAIYINLVDSNPRSFSHVGSCEAHSRLEWLILHGLLTCNVCLSDISTWRPWFRRHSEKIHAHVKSICLTKWCWVVAAS